MPEARLALSAAAWTTHQVYFAPEPRKLIEKVTSAICTRRFHPLPRAIVLTGSLARGEGSFIEEGRRRRALGDAEFVLVFSGVKDLPSPESVASVKEEIESELSAQGITCQVGLSSVAPEYLSRLKPHIYGYELRVSGRVVWGEQDILTLIPPFIPKDIPLEDAWRLLCNRMIELLDGIGGACAAEGSIPFKLKYQVCKLYLDMATSYLLFVGAYAPTYAERSRLLSKLAGLKGQSICASTDLSPFAAEVAAWTRWKLDPHVQAGPDPYESLGMAMIYARVLWRCELACLTVVNDELTDEELMQAWMRREPILDRLRGWASVLRRLGLRQSSREAARWAHLALKGSPRYWVYAAACPLIFRLPMLVGPNRTSCIDRHCEKALEWLPLRPCRARQEPKYWRQLANGVIRNYHQFLVETRS